MSPNRANNLDAERSIVGINAAPKKERREREKVRESMRKTVRKKEKKNEIFNVGIGKKNRIIRRRNF